MARLDFVRSLAALVLFAAELSTAASAQSLQRVTVTALTLSADTLTPHVEAPFHLVITAHVRERVSEFDNLDLPILAELELLGDEHGVVAAAGGTTYREVITVVAHHSGSITVAPVTFDAIDARDGKAKRYFSNSLTLHVAGLLPLAPSYHGSNALLPALLVAAALLAFVVLRRRRVPPSAPVITLARPVPVVAADPRAMLREALGVLRAQRNRVGAMRARSTVRRMVGASDAETLNDVLRRPAASTPDLRDLLRALERAGFTHDADLSAAIAAAIAQLERMT
ncbi:MAG TPA: hypothetical protein VMF11_11550 [Candidatus Baltobacteraceae bacterium]|nr:hypothetical protein [Candidatus Baltobacteraceae bacterium]